MPRLNGKFVSQKRFDEHMAAQVATPAPTLAQKETRTVSEETPVTDGRKTRTAHPLTAVTKAFEKAKKDLAKAQAAADKVADVQQNLTDAQAAFDAAKADLAAVWADVTGDGA